MKAEEEVASKIREGKMKRISGKEYVVTKIYEAE
jgi:hypothetical protein